MIHDHPVIDADSHKCENPAVFFEYIPGPYRHRISLLRDRYGEQRFGILDVYPATGRPELPRVFLQQEGFGKGTYRPYHEETTIGGLFNRVRMIHMDREGIEHQVIYGSIPLAFNSIIDRDLAVVLCRAYNDYIEEDTRSYADRLHPVAVLPLQNPEEAVKEMRRCIEGLGMGSPCLENSHIPEDGILVAVPRSRFRLQVKDSQRQAGDRDGLLEQPAGFGPQAGHEQNSRDLIPLSLEESGGVRFALTLQDF